MAGDKLTSHDLYGDDSRMILLDKQLKGINAELDIVVKKASAMNTALRATPSSTPAGQKKIAAAASDTEKLVQAEQKLLNARSDTAKQLATLHVATAKQNAENRAAARLALSVKGAEEQLAAQYIINTQRLVQMTRATKEQRAEYDKLQKETRAIGEELRKLGHERANDTRNVGNYTSGFRGLISTLKQLAGAYIGVAAARTGFDAIFTQTRALDSLDVALKTTTGSEIAAADAKAFLADLTDRLGISLVDTTKSYLKFSIASKSAGFTVKQSQDIFESFGKAGSTLGLRADELDGIFKALEQIMSKGTVQAEELRGQLGDRLPGAFTILAESMGVSTAELGKMLKEGKVLANEVLPNFAKQVEKTYGIDQIDKVNNLAAAQGRFNREVTLLIEKLDQSGAFKAFFDTLTNGIKFIGTNLSTILSLGKAVLYLATAYTVWKASMFATNALQSLGGAQAIRDITLKGAQSLATFALARAQQALNAAMKANPIGLILTAAIALVGVFDLLIKKTDRAKEAQNALTEARAKASAEVQVQRLQIDQLVDAYGKETTTELEKEKILTRLNDLGVKVIDSNNDQKISIDELKLSTDLYLKSLRLRIEQEVLLEKYRKSIDEKKSLEDEVKKPKNIRGQGGAILIDRVLGTTLSDEGKKKRIAELTKTAEEIEKAVANNFASQKALETGTPDPTPTGLTDEEFNKIIARRRKLNSFLNDGRKKELESLAIDFDVEKREASKLGISLNKLTEAFRKKELEINNEYDIKERELSNSSKFEGRDKDLQALQIAFDKELDAYEKLGIDTLALEQSYRDKKTDILNKYIDIEDAERTKSENKEKAHLDALASISREKLDRDAAANESFKDDFAKELALSREYNDRVFEDAKHTEQEIIDHKLNSEIQYYRDLLEVNKQYNGDLTDQEIAHFNKLIEYLQGQVGKPDPKKAGATDIFSLFGLDISDESKQAISDAFAFAKEQAASYFETLKELSDQEVDRANNRVAEAQRSLQYEMDARRDGYADKVETVQKELALAKKAQEQALRQRQKVQKQELLLNTVLEASNLAVAVAKTLSSGGFYAIPLVAIMLGAFALAKIKAFQLANKQVFGKGDVIDVKGGSHASGNDTPLGMSFNGKPGFVERGEKVGIVNKKAARKYGSSVNDIFNAMNRMQLDQYLNMNRRTAEDMPLIVNASSSFDSSKMESGIDRINRQLGERETIEGNYRVVRKGNHVTRYRIR